MRISCVAVVTLALASTSLAAPVKRNLLGNIKAGIAGVINGNATLPGIAGTVVQSIENPQLTAGVCSGSNALSDSYGHQQPA